jgi:multidrug efflux pump subunit AcrB
MLSAIFVDRPRLAIVIAIVTTIAGMLALYAIPFAQYPDIVPPQVSVSTRYPGASAAIVDATIAQPIEAQVVGVDKMIYMKSVSGDDGSYTLQASFELGTNPDINTVNVNNRVQVALSKLPQDVQRQGVTVKKQSSALLGVIAVYSPKSTHDEPLHFVQLRHHQSARPDQEHPGGWRRDAVGSAGLCHAGLGSHRPVDWTWPDDRRHHQGDPGAKCASRSRAHRRAADFK